MFPFYSRQEKKNHYRDALCDIFISNLTFARLVSLTRSSSGNTLIIPSGFNDVKLKYKCTKRIAWYYIPNTKFTF